MLYRLAMIGIIAFWLVMMGLLVRLETHPETTDILDVPVSYVVRLMFKHAEPSLMTVTEEGKAIGTISVRPVTTGTDGRTCNFSGTLSLQLPMGTRKRFNFNGAIDMDGGLRMRDFHVDLTVLDPRIRLDVKGDMAQNRLTYEVFQDSLVLASQTLPMNASALIPALSRSFGLDPNALPAVTGGLTPPEITARETQIKLRGEQLQVYEVAIREGTEPVAEFYVTELGQIVLANTNFGYTLTADDYQ
jgi:hypothetical protein